MGREESLLKLFETWKKEFCFAPKGERGQFVPDGIVDYEEYEKAEKKILFVLRDPHDADGKYESRGLCDEVLHSSNSFQTWGPIASWTRGFLRASSKFAPLYQIKSESHDPQDLDGTRKYYRKIAIMNLKKASGKGYAEQIKEYAKNHSKLIHGEINIIQPDVIIACGRDVYESLQDILCGERTNDGQIMLDDKMKTYGQYKWVDIGGKRTIVICFRHPAQSAGEPCFYNMCTIRDRYDEMTRG